MTVLFKPKNTALSRRILADTDACHFIRAALLDCGIESGDMHHVLKADDHKEQRCPIMFDPSLAAEVAVPARFADVSPMKRRRSEDSEDRTKKLQYEAQQRDCDSDGGAAKQHHHHHHHSHKKSAVRAASEVPDGPGGVHGVCTLKEGSLKLKISLHRPSSSTPTTPDGDSASPTSLSRLGDEAEVRGNNGIGHGLDNGRHGVGDHLDDTTPCSIPSSEQNLPSGCDIKAQPEACELSGRSSARKNGVPGHFVAPGRDGVRRSLISDPSKLRKKPRRGPSEQRGIWNAPTVGDGLFDGRIRPRDTFHHLRIAVGQNGGRGVVNHASILDHPIVHSRIFGSGTFDGPSVVRSGTFGGSYDLPSRRREERTSNSVIKTSPADSLPLDLSRGTATLPENAPGSRRDQSSGHVPPIGAFFSKPLNRRRLDDVVRRLWARHGAHV